MGKNDERLPGLDDDEKDKKEEVWELQPQEHKGTYEFSGKSFMTRGVAENVQIDQVQTS